MIIKLWDGFVRSFHWLLVLALVGLWYTGGSMDYIEVFGVYLEYTTLHYRLGLFVLALIITRIMWGFVGSEPARFSSFIKGPRAIFNYLRNPFAETHLTHNPGGAVVVVLMLALVLAQAVSGLFIDDAIFFRGPLADSVSNEWVRTLTSYHKQAFDYLLILIALHIVAILVYLVKRKNLIAPMITGKKMVASTKKSPRQVHAGIGFAILIGNLIWVYWWLG